MAEEELFFIAGSLEPLRQRLSPGQQVQGRVIKCLSGQRFVLRVWGYNFCMESSYPFRCGDEIKLTVKELYPKIEFAFEPLREFYVDPVNLRCNLVV